MTSYHLRMTDRAVGWSHLEDDRLHIYTLVRDITYVLR